jgi:phosphoribosylanthranilate isomerase
MKIKICGIRCRHNLQEIQKLEPDFIGFIFYRDSPRFVGNGLSPEDLAIIPQGIKKTGVFVNQDEKEITKIKEEYKLDYVQLHGNETASFCRGLRENGLSIIKSFRVEKKSDFIEMNDFIPYCDYFLFDTMTSKYGGSGKKFDWKIMNGYKAGHPFILSGGIKPEDAAVIMSLSIPSLEGVDINSGFEIQPGLKDLEKLEIFWKNMNRNKLTKWSS